MSKATDPSLYESNFARMDGDRYWTQPWLTKALMDTVVIPARVWEPAAGRGDIVQTLRSFGRDVLASDVDMSEYVVEEPDNAMVCDFLQTSYPPRMVSEGELVPPQAIITNPPYNQPRGISDQFVRHAVNLLGEHEEIRLVAMLLRSEFCKAKTRRDLFGECRDYWGEIVLTTRPRWDWWFRDKPEASPRHNFSWFIWSKIVNGRGGYQKIEFPKQLFHYR